MEKSSSLKHELRVAGDKEPPLIEVLRYHEVLAMMYGTSNIPYDEHWIIQTTKRVKDPVVSFSLFSTIDSHHIEYRAFWYEPEKSVQYARSMYVQDCLDTMHAQHETLSRLYEPDYDPRSLGQSIHAINTERLAQECGYPANIPLVSMIYMEPSVLEPTQVSYIWAAEAPPGQMMRALHYAMSGLREEIAG